MAYETLRTGRITGNCVTVPYQDSPCAPEPQHADGLLDRLQSHINTLQTAFQRLATINERLFGPLPTSACKDPVAALGSGLIERLFDAHGSASSLLSSIHDEIGRLERL